MKQKHFYSAHFVQVGLGGQQSLKRSQWILFLSMEDAVISYLRILRIQEAGLSLSKIYIAQFLQGTRSVY